jgi:hypothetical protein
MTKIERFKETGDIWIFDYNNESNLCSRKWCRAWGTAACTMGRPEKPKDEEDDEAA